MYRLPLYNLMAQTFDCDFYITKYGDGRDKSIKSYDYNNLKNFKEEVILKPLVGHFNWNTSIWRLFRMPYTKYVVAGAWDLSSWFLILLCKFTNKKVFSWSHGLYGREKGIRLWLKKSFFKLCDKCIVYNERSRDLMIENGVKAEKVISVHNSLDYDSQIHFRGNVTDVYASHFANDYPVLFFIGRLIEDKKLDYLIKAAGVLKKKGKDVNVVLIGDGPAKTSLDVLVTNYDLENNVWFYGPCYDEKEKSVLIANADLCVTPGAIGLTCIDSMMYGTPVITKDDFSNQGPEFAAIRDGVTGSFFRTDDLGDMVCKIEEWLNTDMKREQIRQNCYEEIDKYWNPQYEVEQFKKVFL